MSKLSAAQMLSILFAFVILCFLPSSELKLTTPILLLNHCLFASLHAGWVFIITFVVFKAYDCLSNGRFSAVFSWLDGVPLPPRRQVKHPNTHVASSVSKKPRITTDGSHIWNPIAGVIYIYQSWFSECRDMPWEAVASVPLGLTSMPGSFPTTSTPPVGVLDVQSVVHADPGADMQAIQATRPIVQCPVRSRATQSQPSCTMAITRKAVDQLSGYRYFSDKNSHRPVASVSNTYRVANNANIYNRASLPRHTIFQPPEIEQQPMSPDLPASNSVVTRTWTLCAPNTSGIAGPNCNGMPPLGFIPRACI